MTARHVLKRYRSSAQMGRAVANHRWLAETGLPLPRLLSIDRAQMTLSFEHVDGHHVGAAAGLERVAVQLGHWHEGLSRNELATRPVALGSPGGFRLQPFIAPRADLLRTLTAPDALVDARHLRSLAVLSLRSPPSVYKDANVRNVLISGANIHHVDFDDLSLAPAGYDLAKLLISWAMTHGRRPPIEAVLDAYSAGAGRQLCDLGSLAVWIEVHHLLTHRYIADGTYRFGWSDLRDDADADRVAAVLADL